MADTRVTEDRLRSWLDSNQVQRERLCAQLLPLLGDYSNVQPRRPKGGPDGGRDLQALFGGSMEVWGAVGFRNSPRDDSKDKKWVSGKFEDDLNAALKNKPDLQGFVFLTNVDLTPGEQATLLASAKAKGVGHVEVFSRERIRLVLDSVEGWGYRIQFLGIDMSSEEQAAFIERYGARLERMLETQRLELSQQRTEIDAKLSRLEFLQERDKKCRGASFYVHLKEPATPKELGHFRIQMEIINLYERESDATDPDNPHPMMWFCARDSYPTMTSDGKHTKLFGVRTIVTSRNPNEKIQDTVVAATGLTGERIEAWGHLYKTGPFQTLGAFDNCTVYVYVTNPLLEKLEYIGFEVNNYLLIGCPTTHTSTREQLDGRPFVQTVYWPEELTEEEKEVQWTELCVRGPDADVSHDSDIPPPFLQRTISWDFNFDNYTPVKREPEQ